MWIMIGCCLAFSSVEFIQYLKFSTSWVDFVFRPNTFYSNLEVEETTEGLYQKKYNNRQFPLLIVKFIDIINFS